MVKKNKETWNSPDNLIYYITDVYLPQPTYVEFICMHLIFICDHLWQSLLFMRIFLNFSYLWESLFLYDNLCESIVVTLYENKHVYESHHLEQIFYHQNTIMLFCWFHMFPFYVLYFEFFSFCASLFSC